MDETVSPEATVAGEAAAAAVEEVQSREALADATLNAVAAAVVAEDTAEQAHAEASQASDVADTAAGIAIEASDAAAIAQEQTQQVAYMTADMFESLRAENDQKYREMREYIDSRIPLPVKTTGDDGVEEIEADNGTGRVSDSGDGSDADGSSEKSGASGASRQERYGLRHQRR
jgi:hypothetical protein